MASALRTVRWQPVPPVGFIAGPSLQWPNKHASESLDYSLDISGFLEDASFDTIATATAAALPAGLVIAAATNVRGIVTSLISGGVAGQIYTTKISVTTVTGLVTEFDVSLTVS
jgi:hypothetical protein